MVVFFGRVHDRVAVIGFGDISNVVEVEGDGIIEVDIVDAGGWVVCQRMC